MILSQCTSKLLLSNFFVGRFVLAQFCAIASIISWSVKKFIFWWKLWKWADYVSVISPWRRSPRLKFGGPKRKKSSLRGTFCRAKSSFMAFFLIFWPFLTIFGTVLGIYQVCLMDLRLPTTIGVKFQYILVFQSHFWQFFL